MAICIGIPASLISHLVLATSLVSVSSSHTAAQATELTTPFNWRKNEDRSEIGNRHMETVRFENHESLTTSFRQTFTSFLSVNVLTLSEVLQDCNFCGSFRSICVVKATTLCAGYIQ